MAYPMEQTIAILEAAQPKPDHFWQLIIAVAGSITAVLLGWFLNKRKHK